MHINGAEHKKRLVVAVGLLAALAAGLVYLALSGQLGLLAREGCRIFTDRDELRRYVESWGAWAPAAFIAIQALQVVMAPIPGELTGAVGGFIFGAVPNVLYSTIGLTLGSLGAFLAARIIGLPIVRLAVTRQSLERFHFMTERRGIIVALALFTIPGFPKDILCYILGLSPMGLLPFTAVCALGRIPGTIMLSYSGSALYDENWLLLVAVSAICLIVLAAFYLHRDRIEIWLKGRSQKTS